MNMGNISFHEDSYKDLELFFIDEIRIKETEIRFASYLNEFFNFNEDDRLVAEEERDNSDEDVNY